MSQVSVPAPKKSAFNTKELAFTAMFAALIAVCSWISVPTTVPFTLQTFAVFFTLICLGGKKGFFSVLVYLILGTVGIPVFAGFSGGLSAILGMTGGYLIGFLFMAAVYWLMEKVSQKTAIRIFSLVIGILVCYAFGTVWFMIVYTSQVESIGLLSVLGMCVFPFLIPDGIKLALALILAGRLKKYVRF